MVRGNRIYCAMSSASLMRQALVQALHHVSHRSAFQKRLIDQPLMRNVLADLAIETEAALALGMRVARAIDESADNETEAALARIGTTVAKYWNCKRAHDANLRVARMPGWCRLHRGVDATKALPGSTD